MLSPKVATSRKRMKQTSNTQPQGGVPEPDLREQCWFFARCFCFRDFRWYESALEVASIGSVEGLARHIGN